MSTTATRERTWWQRNRVALLLLLALIPAAIVAHGSRYVNVYLRSVPSAAIEARDGTAHLREDASTKKATWTREATVTLDRAEVVPSSGGRVAVDGARLYAIDLTFAAPSASPLDGCRVELVDSEGRTYATGPGTTSDGSSVGGLFDCVPSDAPGPVMELDGERSDAGTRPATWQVTAQIAVPEAAQIRSVRVWWAPPTYLSFPVKG